MRTLIEKMEKSSDLEEGHEAVVAGAKKRLGEVKGLCRSLEGLVSKYWEAASKTLPGDGDVRYRQRSAARSIDDLYVLLNAVRVKVERAVAEEGRGLSISDNMKAVAR